MALAGCFFFWLLSVLALSVHGRDKKLYPSMLTVVISLLFIIILSLQNGKNTPINEKLAKEVQAICIKNGKCPEDPIAPSLRFIGPYSSADNQLYFCIDYCYQEES